MELYNKEYVFFDWEDRLKGKKGFFADTIYELKSKVKNGFELLECHFSNNPTGFHFSNSISNNAYQFFYYDPYYEFRKAYLEGKQLQFKDSTGNWRDVEGEPIFTRDEYRIKPENTYVPFDSVQELIDAWKKKSGLEFNRELLMPLIWVKLKESNDISLITDFYFDSGEVALSDTQFSLEELWSYYTFLDDSIIGKVKEHEE